MEFRGFGRTDVGRARSNNEDAFLVSEELGVFAVCDGMGGHAGGEVASDTVSKFLKKYISEHSGALSSVPDDEVTSLLDAAVQGACARVYELAKQMPNLAGMGTTMTLMYFRGEKGFMAHVGDSRLYLMRGGEVHQLSDDHTYLNELLKTGRVTREQAERIVGSHAITRAVGLQSSVLVDHLTFDVLCNDTFVMCSDGFSNYVDTEDELCGLIRLLPVETMPDRLVDVALERGGGDNVTVVSIDVRPDAEYQPDEEKRESEITFRTETLRNVALFQHLSMPERVSLLAYVVVEVHEPGEVIVNEGEVGDRFHVVLEGELSVRHKSVEVTTLGYGAHFGEMSVLSSRPRSATVVATQPTRLMTMSRDNFAKLVRQQPDIGVKLLWNFAQVLCVRLDEATERAMVGNIAELASIVAPPNFRGS